MALDRIVTLVDMDCFYVQVERRQNPELKGKPCAVVQYKAWKGGAIIAVSYEARRLGVTRHMRGDEAKEKCPDIALVRVPEARGKANLIHYREAGAEVIEVLSRFCESCERASVDEAYFDLTENVKIRLATMSLEEIAQQSAASTVIEGFMIDDGGKKCVDLAAWQAAVRDDENIKRLAIGAIIASEMRAAVLKETQFTCSAGVAHNKMLAKLCGGLHKPDQQTLLPHCAVPKLFESVPIQKVRNLGGKLGHDVSCTLKAVKMSDIARFSLSELQGRLGDKTGEWLHYLGKGIDYEPVRPRQLAKSTGCSKNFPGKSKLDTGQRVKYWLDQLAGELSERLERESELNKRVARLLTVGVRTETDSSFSRSCQLKESSAPQMAAELFNLLLPFNTVKDGKSDTWHPAILTLNISASRFEVISDQNNTPSISAFFHKKNITQTNFCRLETESHSSANSSDGLQQDQGTDGLSSGIELEDLNACRGDDRALHSASKILKDKLDKKSDAKGDNKASTFKKGIESFFPGSNSRAAKNNAGVIKSIDHATVIRSSREPYRASEIDVTVLESLPEDIRQEITLSLKRGKEVVQTAARGGTERESFLDNGIDYCIGDASSGNHPLCEEIVDDSELIQCQKCERTFSKCEMPEHLDYHFALDLQKGDRQLCERDPCNEPPKKKPRTTIRSFFSPKKAF